MIIIYAHKITQKGNVGFGDITIYHRNTYTHTLTRNISKHIPFEFEFQMIGIIIFTHLTHSLLNSSTTKQMQDSLIVISLKHARNVWICRHNWPDLNDIGFWKFVFVLEFILGPYDAPKFRLEVRNPDEWMVFEKINEKQER